MWYFIAEHVAIYWTCALAIAAFREQATPWQWRSVARVLFNQVFVAPLVVVLLGVPGDAGGTCVALFLGIPIVLAVMELGFYATHRALHTSLLYPLHVTHHKWADTVPWCAFDAHPVEHALSNLLPALTGPILVGWPRDWVRAWAALATANSVWAHQYSESTHHARHHRRPYGNYAISAWVDSLFGTALPAATRDISV
jgi:fatty acid hydroxylase domain-containing protein 2